MIRESVFARSTHGLPGRLWCIVATSVSVACLIAPVHARSAVSSFALPSAAPVVHLGAAEAATVALYTSS